MTTRRMSFLAACLAVAPAAADRSVFAVGEASVGYVNVQGDVPGPGGGGNQITIELKNANGAVIGSTTYTTPAGGVADGTIADALATAFKSQKAGASHAKDKGDGKEVIVFRANKDGGQPFTIHITNGEPQTVITSKATGNDANRSFGCAPANFDVNSPGSASVVLTGINTEWQSGTYAVTGVHFADSVNVDSFTIDSDTQITAHISWKRGCSGFEHVVVLGDYVDEDNGNSPLENIVHDVSTDPIEYSGSLVCPTVSQWGLLALALLVLSAGTLVAMRGGGLKVG